MNCAPKQTNERTNEKVATQAVRSFFQTLSHDGITLHIQAMQLERGCVAVLTGGSLQHVGAVALATPRPSLDDPHKVSSSVSVLSVISHKDDVLARTYALRMAAAFNVEVSFTAGVHVDNPTSGDFKTISFLADKLVADCLAYLKDESKLLRAQWATDEQVKAVDTNGVFTKALSRKTAHSGQGILHEAFEILLTDSDDKLVLCRRSGEKKLWHGYLSGTCAGHPFVGEDTRQAAYRRLAEEVQLTAVPLHEIGSFIYHKTFEHDYAEHEYCYAYTGTLTGDMHVDPNEISEVVCATVEEIDMMIAEKTDRFTPWFLEAFELYKKTL